VRRYLEIEHARFGDRLGVSWAVEPAAETALVPQLIVQPLVENALKHGLAPRAEGGALAISVRVAGGSLEIAVADDGVGLPEAADDARPGVGLANIRARLAKIYGRAASLAVEPAPGGGAIARVTLPFRSQPGVAR
jgi:LytS/YehU family sensor histidine kinase